MTPALALALIGATLVLVAIPGPNVALIVANTLSRGIGIGALTVLGTTVGVGLQLAVVVLGLAAVVEHAAAALTWAKWAGVAYLLWLGVQSWRAGQGDLSARPSARPAAALFLQGLMIAVVNPKTLLFNAAFLSQFLGPEATTGTIVTLAAIFLAVVLVGDMLWAVFAQSARGVLMRYGRLRHRVTGSLLIGAGIGLALARADR